MALLESLTIVPENEGDIPEELEPDPAPSEKPAARTRKRGTGTAKRTRVTSPRATQKVSTAKLAKQVADDFCTLIEGGAAMWSMTDQCCAPVLEQQARPISDALAAILARNPRLLEKFANADMAVYTMQTAALLRALLPVGRSVYRNHIGKSGEAAHDDAGLDQFPVYRPQL